MNSRSRATLQVTAKGGKPGMVCPKDHKRMRMRRAVVSFVGQYRQDQGIGALCAKTIGKTFAGGGRKLDRAVGFRTGPC